MALCDDCPKRSICNTLCPEAEVYANQDYVEQSELTETELLFDFNNSVSVSLSLIHI